MISLYCTSVQLGIRERVIGALCGMIPIVNLIVLHRILKITAAEVEFETEKANLNAARKDSEICKTKYPILMVHGVFFRDFKVPNYWGRIPNELTQNGATVLYGNHQSALSVADSAAELTARIKEITRKTGCKKSEYHCTFQRRTRLPLFDQLFRCSAVCRFFDYNQHSASRLQICRLPVGKSPRSTSTKGGEYI